MKTFNRNFAAILKRRGLTQMRAAEVFGLSQSLVSAYALGLHQPTRRTAEHLAARLGISADELLSGDMRKAGAGKAMTHRRVKYVTGPRSKQPYDAAMMHLKQSWKRKPHQRDQITLAIRVLFPGHVDDLIQWFNKP
jgi:transcriptional regulator with XRE-family HTH domain